MSAGAQDPAPGPAAAPPASAFAPLRHRTYAWLWTAALVANVGTWFRDVANGWLMTELSPSPVLVALVQTAALAPVFLLSLPAGALSDILDRRRLLLAIQAWLVLAAGTLTLASAMGWMTPGLLLALTLAGGIGAALMGPPWQSIVPELVPRADLRAAIALNSLGINIARAIGPAVGGLVVATLGVTVAYALDLLSYLLVVAVLLAWKREAPADPLGSERFMPAMAAGVRYAWASRDLQRALVRSGLFFLFASAYWALLPLVARGTLAGGPGLYGLLLAAAGLGAICGALLLPRLGSRLQPGSVVLAGTLLTSAAMLVLAAVPLRAAALAAMFVAGAAWISVLTTLNVTAQSVLPNWVRGRGLAVYLTVFFGAMTLGSAGWGQFAQVAGVPAALAWAAALGALAGLAAMRIRLPRSEADLTPSMHWPEPANAAGIDGDRGPVMIQVDYRIDPARRAEALALLRALSAERLRDGSYGWQVFEDTQDPALVSEVFFAASWSDHLRTHARVTREDATMQERLAALLAPGHPPRITHRVAVREDAPGE